MKVGDGKSGAKEPNYHELMRHEIAHFLKILRECHQMAQHLRQHHFSVLDNSVNLLYSTLKEIPRSGMKKQGEELRRTYQVYRKDPTDANYASLEHTLATLQQFNC